jgi:hypothetical protein
MIYRVIHLKMYRIKDILLHISLNMKRNSVLTERVGSVLQCFEYRHEVS